MRQAVERAWRWAGDVIRRRMWAYSIFTGQKGRLVIADLYRFAGGTGPVFHRDIRVQDVMTGRREVVDRIRRYANLSHDELMRIYVSEKPDHLNQEPEDDADSR